MPTTTDTSVVQKLHDAVLQARLARHHSTCVCCQYRDATGAPYCNATDWRYSSMIDRLITAVLATHRTDTGHTDTKTNTTVS